MAIKLLRDAYTGPDGKAYAIGRIYSAPVLILGLVYPTVALIKNHPYTPVEMATYLCGLGGACWIFIKGHNSVDEEEHPSAVTSQAA